ncbi:MAG: hypothetical protein IJS65_06690 [Clostridia bacterium]|nr:hypothetical protein [Clostridia bacterium]
MSLTKTYDELSEYAFKRSKKAYSEPSVFDADCDIIEYMLSYCEISADEQNRFFINVGTEKLPRAVINERKTRFTDPDEDDVLRYGTEAHAFNGETDYSHTSAEWESVLSLGIYGLRERAAEYEKRETDPAKKHFYARIKGVYSAALAFMLRAADCADENNKPEMAKGLRALSRRAPETLFEAFQTVFVYYFLQHKFDGTYLRTLGRLDSLLYPFYAKEDPAFARALVADFFREAERLKAPANMPFAIGGSDERGDCIINDLSYLFIDEYAKADTVRVKMHFLYAGEKHDGLLKAALDAVRRGRNAIVFMSDKKIRQSLEKLGIDPSDAAYYHVVGCYECGGRGEIPCSCTTHVCIPKAVEYALTGGVDMLTGKQIGLPRVGEITTFDGFLREYERQLVHICRCGMRKTDLWERHNKDIHSAPFLSGTYLSAMEKGEDLYCGHSAKYPDSSLNAIGLGTAADSLAAIRKLVFEDGELTLSELTDILKNNWEGHEALRLRVKNKFPKYGINDDKTDALAKRTVALLAETVSRRPNAKGGVYRLGALSITLRWEYGDHCAASADGRRSGEPLSQNTSASFGADREGVTAHFLSAAKIDASDTPNGAIIDIDLHSSAVQGENGLRAMASSLIAFFKMGGFCVHYNVLDADVLRDARAHPEKYPNLQVRLCGWNVRFSTLTDRAKEEFISRAEAR